MQELFERAKNKWIDSYIVSLHKRGCKNIRIENGYIVYTDKDSNYESTVLNVEINTLEELVSELKRVEEIQGHVSLYKEENSWIIE